MSKILASLEENKADILAAVPEELRAECEATLLKVEEIPPLTGDAAIAAVKQALKDNPQVDEIAAAEALTNIAAPALAPPASAEELDAHQAELLKAAEAMGPYTATE